MNTGISFVYVGPTWELSLDNSHTPCVEYGYVGYLRFFGLEEIKKFIRRYKEGKLPPYDIF